MNVPLSAAERLRERGHDAVHVAERREGHLPDEAIFALAHRENRIVVTFDLDFGQIERLATEERTSVVILRLRSIRAAHILTRVNVALAAAGAALTAGALVLVDDTRVRIRPH